MKAAIIVGNDNYYYPLRTKYVEQELNKYCTEVVTLSSDFDHYTKQKSTHTRNNLVEIHTTKYKKNISIRRIFSNIILTNNIYRYLKKYKPDIVYYVIPPNFLVYRMSKLKQKFNIKMILEIADMWPESFPITNKNFKTLFSPFFKIWKNMRDKYIRYNDFIITECQLYNNHLSNLINVPKYTTLYFSAVPFLVTESSINKTSLNNSINIVYLGSINNIIDIDLISTFLSELVKLTSVNINIIGDGEKRITFVERLISIGCTVVFHGKIYDDQKKFEIYKNMHFGINMMKETSHVGLTMKSIDYFRFGIPMINNIKYDTAMLINEYRCGYNISIENCILQAKNIAGLSDQSYMKLKLNVLKCFNENFSDNIFSKRFSLILKEIGVENEKNTYI